MGKYICNKAEECLKLSMLERLEGGNAKDCFYVEEEGHNKPHIFRDTCLNRCQIYPKLENSHCVPIDEGGNHES